MLWTLLGKKHLDKYQERWGREKLRKINSTCLSCAGETEVSKFPHGAWSMGQLYLPLYSQPTPPEALSPLPCLALLLPASPCTLEKVLVWMISYKVTPPWTNYTAFSKLKLKALLPHWETGELHALLFCVCWKASPEVWKSLDGYFYYLHLCTSNYFWALNYLGANARANALHLNVKKGGEIWFPFPPCPFPPSSPRN